MERRITNCAYLCLKQNLNLSSIQDQEPEHFVAEKKKKRISIPFNLGFFVQNPIGFDVVH